MKKTILLAFTVPAFVGAIALFPVENQAPAFHTDAELAFFEKNKLATSDHTNHLLSPPEFLPIDSSVLFPTAKLCGGCHGRDPNMNALITTSGT